MAYVWYMSPTEQGVSYTEHKLSIVDTIALVNADMARIAGHRVAVDIRAGVRAYEILATLPGFIDSRGTPEHPAEEGTGRLNMRWEVRRDHDLAPNQIVMDDRLIEVKPLPAELRPVNVANNLSQLLTQVSGQLEAVTQRLEVLEKKSAKVAAVKPVVTARKRTRRKAA